MHKKSQITVYILLGIVILMAFFTYFYLNTNRIKNSAVEKSTKLSFDSGAIQVYIETCLKNVASDGIIFISSRGGYYDLPDDYFGARPVTSFYVKNSLDMSPALEEVQKELSKYIKDQLDFCINNIEFAGKTIEFGDKEVSTMISGSGYISVNLKMPTKIISGDSTFAPSDFRSTVVDDRLIKSFNLAKNITQEITKNPQYLAFSSIFHQADSKNFKVVIDAYNESTYLFQLIDKLNSEQQYKYNFAININLKNEG